MKYHSVYFFLWLNSRIVGSFLLALDTPMIGVFPPNAALGCCVEFPVPFVASSGAPDCDPGCDEDDPGCDEDDPGCDGSVPGELPAGCAFCPNDELGLFPKPLLIPPIPGFCPNPPEPFGTAPTGFAPGIVPPPSPPMAIGTSP